MDLLEIATTSAGIPYEIPEAVDNAILDAEIEHYLNEIEREGTATTSMAQAERYARKFKDFLISKGITERFESMENARLCAFLRYFYAEIRKDDGTYLSPSTLGCLRAGIQRFLTSAPINRVVDIIKGEDFLPANRMIRSMGALFLKNGGHTSRFMAIEDEDLKRLRKYFDRKGPLQLQEEIVFSLLYYFGLRGRETIWKLKRSDIKLGCDSNGRKYVELEPKQSKNVRVDKRLTRSMYADSKECRAYAVLDASLCPVTAMKVYLSKLPALHTKDLQCLFPEPSRKVNDEWYSSNLLRGVNWINGTMKRLSELLKLSKQYTNHCVRVTVVTALAKSGLDSAAIKAVTGHKSCNSVDRYKRLNSDTTMNAASAILAKRLNNGRADVARGNGQAFQLELENPWDDASAGTVSVVSTQVIQSANGQVVRANEGVCVHGRQTDRMQTAESVESERTGAVSTLFRGCGNVTINTLNIHYH